MPHWVCSVYGCASASKEFSGFRFPSHELDRVRYDDWVHFCRRRHPTRADQKWIPTRNNFICERHFEPSCIVRHSKKRDEEGNPVVLKGPLLTPDAKPMIRDLSQPPRNGKSFKDRPYIEEAESNPTKKVLELDYQPLPLHDDDDDAVDVPPSADMCIASLQHDVMRGFQTMQVVPSSWCVRIDAVTTAVQYLKLQTAVATDAFSAAATVSAVLEATFELKVFVCGRLLSPLLYPSFSPVTPSALSMILQVLNSLQLCTGFDVGLFQSSNLPSCDRYTAITGERYRHKVCELVLKTSSIRSHDRCNHCNRAYRRAAETELNMEQRGGIQASSTADKYLSREALIAKLHQLKKEKKSLQVSRKLEQKRANKLLGSLGEDKKESSVESSESDQEDVEEEPSAPVVAESVTAAAGEV